MATKKLVLVGADRYSYKAELFQTGTVYLVDEAKADYLLSQIDEFTGFPYFEESSVANATGKALNLEKMSDRDTDTARVKNQRTQRRIKSEASSGEAPAAKGIKPDESIVEV